MKKHVTGQVSGLAQALLATDALARDCGAGGLKPELRAALAAGLRFPAQATAPQQQAQGALPAHVVLLAPRQTGPLKTEGAA